MKVTSQLLAKTHATIWKFLKIIKVTSQLKFKNPWTHMIVMLCRFNIMLTCYNVKKTLFLLN